jgi:threonine aldolase
MTSALIVWECIIIPATQETMDHAIDLYSDTVTQPTPGMRHAMAQAVVGDEQRGEDPTTNALQTQSLPLCSARRPASSCPPQPWQCYCSVAAHETGEAITCDARCHILNSASRRWRTQGSSTHCAWAAWTATPEQVAEQLTPPDIIGPSPRCKWR